MPLRDCKFLRHKGISFVKVVVQWSVMILNVVGNSYKFHTWSNKRVSGRDALFPLNLDVSRDEVEGNIRI